MLRSSAYSSLSAIGHRVSGLLAYPLIALIYLYRFTLSPIMGGSCRFYPTCSHYAEEALRKYGVLRGGRQAIGRLFKCHPWGGEGGYDPVE